MVNCWFRQEISMNESKPNPSLSRRGFLFDSAIGFGSIALSSLLAREVAALNPQSAIRNPQSQTLSRQSESLRLSDDGWRAEPH
jgi:hypothetical protein